MSFCTKCGTELSDGAFFCSTCGAKIESNHKDTNQDISDGDENNIDIKNTEGSNKLSAKYDDIFDANNKSKNDWLPAIGSIFGTIILVFILFLIIKLFNENINSLEFRGIIILLVWGGGYILLGLFWIWIFKSVIRLIRDTWNEKNK